VLVEADYPDVKLAHEVTLPAEAAVRKRLAFRNEAARLMRYTARSSDPALVTVLNPEWTVPALDTKHIDLLFHACPAMPHSHTAEAFLFLASEDRAIQETRLLRITYT